MWHKVLAAAVLGCLVLSGCSQLERLSIIRPSAQQRGYTQVAPTYDVSGKHAGKHAPDAELLLVSATDAFRAGRLDEAERLAEQARRAQPTSGDANTLLGAIFDARNNHDKAGAYYRAAAEVAPQNGIYANNYGGWLCANGHAAESLVWFERALADVNYPTPVAALGNAGACARLAKQPQRAEDNWRRALSIDRVNVAALGGMTALEFERGNYLDARAFAERWLAVTPKDRMGLQLAANIEQKLGDNEAASRYLSRLQALSTDPKSASPAQ